MKCPMCDKNRLQKHVYYPDIWDTRFHSEQLNQYRHHMKPLEIYYECNETPITPNSSKNKGCGWVGNKPTKGNNQ